METMECAPSRLHRLGTVMEPNLADPHEAGGVLNPAAARGPDGRLYLLPRLVAAGNYSRIGLARVVMDRRGNPVGVERMGVVLEPHASYELNGRTGGGVEDPRVTHIAALGAYIMTYTAFGPDGPRVAVAVSRDLLEWHRSGLVHFAPFDGVDMNGVDNKDAVLFPEPVHAPDGRLALAMIHRPDVSTLRCESARVAPLLPDRPSMWISYAPLDEITAGICPLFGQHHLLARPRYAWECLKVGGGTPPVRTRAGWLVLYHGVAGRIVEGAEQQQEVCYSAGALLLDEHDPRRVLYRSSRSILAPRVAAEREGVVPRVVFPTGVDVRPDGALDVYYGMADSRIGIARARGADLALRTVAQAA